MKERKTKWNVNNSSTTAWLQRRCDHRCDEQLKNEEWQVVRSSFLLIKYLMMFSFCSRSQSKKRKCLHANLLIELYSVGDVHIHLDQYKSLVSFRERERERDNELIVNCSHRSSERIESNEKKKCFEVNEWLIGGSDSPLLFNEKMSLPIVDDDYPRKTDLRRAHCIRQPREDDDEWTEQLAVSFID